MSSEGESDLQIVVPEGTRWTRADKILAKIYPDLSRSRWQKLFQAGRVWQEDRVLAQKNKLHAGDVVEFSIPAVEPIDLRPVEMPLSILFEDEEILVLNKDPGRIVHPGAGTGDDTLVHGLLHHCKGSLSGIGGKERPGIVHRLDKDTSGVMIVAKTDTAFQSLSEQFAGRSIQKFYTAIARGVPDPTEGTIEEPIARHPYHRVRMDCRPEGRPSKTDYWVERDWGKVAQIRLQIHTGRTHQIRVHLKHLGHSVLGDALYGYKEKEGMPTVPRVMLHAQRLVFVHPVTGEEMTFEAPVPDDFQQVIDELDKLT